MTDQFTPDATAEADTEQASAGATGVGAGSTTHAGQTQSGTGTVQTGFTETGHAQMSDVNVQELMSTANGLMTMAAASANALNTTSAATLKSVLDAVQATRAQNAAVVDNLAMLSNQLVQDFGNKAMHRHSEIAADRQWNINETDFYAAVAAAVAAAMAEKSFEK
jgi:hypothetical protein